MNWVLLTRAFALNPTFRSHSECRGSQTHDFRSRSLRESPGSSSLFHFTPDPPWEKFIAIKKVRSDEGCLLRQRIPRSPNLVQDRVALGNWGPSYCTCPSSKVRMSLISLVKRSGLTCSHLLYYSTCPIPRFMHKLITNSSPPSFRLRRSEVSTYHSVMLSKYLAYCLSRLSHLIIRQRTNRECRS